MPTIAHQPNSAKIFISYPAVNVSIGDKLTLWYSGSLTLRNDQSNDDDDYDDSDHYWRLLFWTLWTIMDDYDDMVTIWPMYIMKILS